MKRHYRCVKCGLELWGRITLTGTVVADNGPPSDDPPIDCVCMGCLGDD